MEGYVTWISSLAHVQCMKQFRTQLRDFELRVLNPVGFALIPPENTAYQYLECVPYHS